MHKRIAGWIAFIMIGAALAYAAPRIAIPSGYTIGRIMYVSATNTQGESPVSTNASGNLTVPGTLAVTGAQTFTGATTHSAAVAVGTTLTLTDKGTVTLSSDAGTCSKPHCVITTEAETTAQNAIETYTVTNTIVAATSQVHCNLYNGTNTQGTPMIGTIAPGSGSFVVKVINKHATAEAFNGTLKLNCSVVL
jgi:hypothetical protein